MAPIVMLFNGHPAACSFIGHQLGGVHPCEAVEAYGACVVASARLVGRVKALSLVVVAHTGKEGWIAEDSGETLRGGTEAVTELLKQCSRRPSTSQ
jgi:hypothetical protein